MSGVGGEGNECGVSSVVGGRSGCVRVSGIGGEGSGCGCVL